MTTHYRRMFIRLPLVLLLLGILLGWARPGRAESYQIQVVARPVRLVYGTDNKVVLTVIVHDTQGREVADGTPVYFVTTLGTLINDRAYTEHGQAVLMLDNQTGPGKARVTVTVGASQQTLIVEYLGPGGVVVETPKRLSYRLKASQVYYSADRRVFDLSDDAEFIAPAFSISASAIQYDLNEQIITAQGHVTITAGLHSLSVEKTRIAIKQDRGSSIEVEPNLLYKSFLLSTLEAQEDESAKSVDFHAIDPQPTKTWIVSKEALVFPGEFVQFRRPRFYLNSFDHVLFSLPYHVLDLRSSGAGLIFNSEITLTSDAGLNVDFPIYYAASSEHTGVLHIRQVTRGSRYYRGNSGLQASIEEEYLVGEYGDGGLYLDDLLRPTRSVSWDHRHQFGTTHLNVSASYDRYSPETPYSTRIGFSAMRPFGPINLNATSNLTSFQGSRSIANLLTIGLPSLSFGKTRLSLNINPYLGLDNTFTPSTSTQAETTTSNFYQGLRLGLGFPSLNLLGGTVSPTVNGELAHEADGTLTQYYDAGVSFRRPLSRIFSSSLSYGYSLSKSSASTTMPASQRLSLNVSGAKAHVWDMFSYASYTPDSETVYGSMGLTYFLPWQRKADTNPPWFFRYHGNVTSGSGQTTAAHLLSFGRDIGAYSLVLHYSPTGNTGVTGIGSGTGSRLALELVRQGW